ncbi:RAS guanyl-releasing protein 1 [Octopus sinensis]|nr:RAS guanyl-releasing protein 1 [Octopus sinensis]
MVLNRTTPAQRAEVIVKFINVAQKLRNLQNFNTLMAVVGGLTHSALARLSKTNACLSSDTQKLLIELTELLSTNNNFSNYRRQYLQCTGFRVPILGVHLKDLISLHTALADKVDGVSTSLIHFRKMVQLYQIFKELTCLQNENLPLDTNMDLVNTLRLSLDMHYTEDNIYELSLAREPRSSLSAPVTPTKPVVFADWVAGVSPPDAETINKHVHNMVEAVFKNYDHDKDGFICNAEFEAIAGNFPFIDSFCVLDADKDGMISKSEMKTYFIRANCHSLRSSFKHDFHEKTYFQPTFCTHCTGLLWGLIKQGWKCKDCTINVHKHCKDMVVMECRPKLNSPRRHDSVFNDSEYSCYNNKHRMLHDSKSHRSTQTDNDLLLTPNAKPLSEAPVNGEEFYEEQSLLYDRLLKAEEEQCITEEIQLEKR